ncbi:hypothetical protein SSPIM334S_02960 [Streptomyces spiroverticillatus]
MRKQRPPRGDPLRGGPDIGLGVQQELIGFRA